MLGGPGLGGVEEDRAVPRRRPWLAKCSGYRPAMRCIRRARYLEGGLLDGA